MATAANFAATPRAASGTLSSAGTLGGTNPVDIFTAGSNGSRIDSVFIKATAATTAGQVRLAVYDGAWRVIKEVVVTAITPSAGTSAFESQVALGIVLATGQKLQANTLNGEGFNVTAFGGDF
jgi:hypothetical protein